MHFTYEYCHSGVGGVAVSRLLFNLDFFLRHFHFWSLRRYICNRTIFLEATCPFLGLSFYGTPGSKDLSYLTIIYTLRRGQKQDGA